MIVDTALKYLGKNSVPQFLSKYRAHKLGISRLEMQSNFTGSTELIGAVAKELSCFFTITDPGSADALSVPVLRAYDGRGPAPSPEYASPEDDPIIKSVVDSIRKMKLADHYAAQLKAIKKENKSRGIPAVSNWSLCEQARSRGASSVLARTSPERVGVSLAIDRSRASEMLFFLLDDADVVAAYRSLMSGTSWLNFEARKHVNKINDAWCPFFIEAVSSAQSSGALDPNFDPVARIDRLCRANLLHPFIFADPLELVCAADKWRVEICTPKRFDLNLPLAD